MLSEIEFDCIQTFFLTITLIDFFEGVIKSENLNLYATFENITNFICDNHPTLNEGT